MRARRRSYVVVHVLQVYYVVGSLARARPRVVSYIYACRPMPEVTRAPEGGVQASNRLRLSSRHSSPLRLYALATIRPPAGREELGVWSEGDGVPCSLVLPASFDNPSVCLFSSIWHMRAHAPRPIPICHLPTQASGCTLSPCASNRKCNCFSLRRPPGPSTACARCHPPPPPSHTGERVPGRDSAFAGCSKQSLRIFAVPSHSAGGARKLPT